MPQLAQARKLGLVKIHEPHEQKVGEAITRVQAPKKKQAVGSSIKR
jgi:hypothetical protein